MVTLAVGIEMALGGYYYADDCKCYSAVMLWLLANKYFKVLFCSFDNLKTLVGWSYETSLANDWSPNRKSVLRRISILMRYVTFAVNRESECFLQRLDLFRSFQI